MTIQSRRNHQAWRYVLRLCLVLWIASSSVLALPPSVAGSQEDSNPPLSVKSHGIHPAEAICAAKRTTAETAAFRSFCLPAVANPIP